MSENIRAEEAKAELEEHVSYSRQLEAEFDEQLNGMKRDLGVRDRELVKLTAERDRLRENLAHTRKEAISTGTILREQLQAAVEERDRLAKQVQHLEQQNDDLERELRITSETLTDTERKLNAELEAHALLTTELEMKDELKASSEQCQRLEDEIRDLKLDNTVKDTKIKNWQLVDKNPSLTLRGEKQKEFGKNGLIKLSVTGTEKVLCDNVSKTARLNSAPNESGVASKINSLPSPLARNVSPIIADLLRTIQASVI
ncbi:Nuclear distribution protein nudE-like 1 [Toxocara canis]|uniref:Nuclear distribution protein nudE-like 1 n=1 Tax=Toxocara canis TaxID=6265 RepID=A0A0B2VEM9_TOXCA|nr:Nuclear distribution protein nudE-like 1 [Toxocara canis]